MDAHADVQSAGWLILFSLDAVCILDFRRALWFDKRNSPRRLYGTQAHTSRRLLFSSALASAVEDSRPRHMSNEVLALFMARKTLSKSSAAMTHALAAPRADSRTAACSRGSFDGSDRNYFFPRIVSVFAARASNQTMKPTQHFVASFRSIMKPIVKVLGG
jgi:hypothetical protein